jgi:UDP-N-acetyl-D-glucosamine dehydrogenase
MNLEKKIKEKKAKVAVVGLGYVGLPTAVHIAKAGFEVFGIDIKKEKVKKIQSGNSYIGDVLSKELKDVVQSGKLKAFNNYLPLKNSDVVLICVPTPLDKVKNPDLTYVKETVKEIAKHLHKEQLIILESTCPPETTRKLILPELEKTGLRVGKDFYLAHCPERIDPGNKKWNSRNISRVVGGITKKCTNLAKVFYQTFLGVEIIEVSSPEVAEMTKLLENAFRLVNISFINEMALLAGRMGIDIWEVIEAAKTKPFGFMPFYPSPKCGGHCIPIVPFFLSSKAKEYHFWTRFIELAGEINEQMPHFVMTKVIWVLNLKRKPVRGSKVLVWGVAYKKDVGDTRESAAYDVIADLIRKGAKVDYFDPYVKEFEITHRILKTPAKLKSIKYSLQKIKKYDLVLILTDHSGFDYEKLAKNSKLVIDTRNAIKLRKHKNVFYL